MSKQTEFEKWWDQVGRFIDPDTDDVPWFDKRKELCQMAFCAARLAGWEEAREACLYEFDKDIACGEAVVRRSTKDIRAAIAALTPKEPTLNAKE